jgi:hypothetical protein
MNDARFNIGAGDFTIEGWIYVTNPDAYLSVFCVGSTRSGSVGLAYSPTSKAVYFARYGDTAGAGNGAIPISPETWTHVRGVKKGGVSKLFINGVEDTASGYNGMGDVTLTNASVGPSWGATNANWGQGLVTEATFIPRAVGFDEFTPPSRPVTPQSDALFFLSAETGGIWDMTGKNNIQTVNNAKVSTSIHKYGTGSVELDGGSNLLIPYSDDFEFGADDFTIEAWVNPTALNGTSDASTIISAYNGIADTSYRFEILNTGKLQMVGGGNKYLQGSSTVDTNTWTHVAVTRDQGIVRLFQNGAVVADDTITGNYSVTPSGVGVGKQPSDNGGSVTRFFSGYIDDIRVTKGKARYTATFTPPEKLPVDQLNPYIAPPPRPTATPAPIIEPADNDSEPHSISEGDNNADIS